MKQDKRYNLHLQRHTLSHLAAAFLLSLKSYLNSVKRPVNLLDHCTTVCFTYTSLVPKRRQNMATMAMKEPNANALKVAGWIAGIAGNLAAVKKNFILASL